MHTNDNMEKIGLTTLWQMTKLEVGDKYAHKWYLGPVVDVETRSQEPESTRY